MAFGMTARVLAIACLVCVGAASSAAEDRRQQALSVAGVQKVIQMLNDMLATSKQEKNDEQVAYSKFDTWCKEEQASLKAAIQRNSEEIESLDTEILQLGADIKALGEDIAKLESGIADDEASIKTETEERDKEHAAFLAEQQDYSESVSALERAIATLEREDYDRPAGAAALLQVSTREELPAQLRSIITAFLAMKQKQEPDLMDYNAPEANAYEFQSTGIIDVLKKLLDEFRAKLATCQKEEMNAEHAFQMIKQDLLDY
jgi:chromosome segregation ATPase